jgi:ABC-type bacteriocin/lantibiotic exporter with double-glycine peptidase domain
VKSLLQICVILALGGTVVVGVEILLLARHFDHTIAHVVNVLLTKARDIPVSDGIDPVFRQAHPETCGAAAATYLLTKLGDVVFEEQFIDHFGDIPSGGFTLVDMHNYVATRGFDSVAYHATIVDLPKPGDPPLIAHLNREHFVVVHSANSQHVVLFDPAYGSTFAVKTNEFVDQWSGIIFKLSTKAPASL